MQKTILALALAVLAGARPAGAADVAVLATDGDGQPLANAVIALDPPDGAPPPPAPDDRIIDQQHETFIPLVTILRRGGAVVFRNSDTTRHHAYSFSPVKRFELMQEPGEVSEPIRFDQPGVAAIGCNIHDHMVAYVYVADTPWTGLTDAAGRAVIRDVPAGPYRATAWHPRLRPGAAPPAQSATIGAAGTALAIRIPVLPERPRLARHEHEY